jgi:hypothetical protein
MFKLSPSSFSGKFFQALLAVGYVALIRQLLAIQASLFGEASFWFMAHFCCSGYSFGRFGFAVSG